MFTQLAVIVIYMTAWYLVARALRRFDVADIAWGPGFIVTALAVEAIGSPNLRAYLVMALVIVWGLRLSLHVYLRNRGKPEDARYKAWRQEWGKNANIRAFLNGAGAFPATSRRPMLFGESISAGNDQMAFIMHVFGLFILVAASEMLNGIARTLFLNKRVGVMNAKRISLLPACWSSGYHCPCSWVCSI